MITFEAFKTALNAISLQFDALKKSFDGIVERLSSTEAAIPAPDWDESDPESKNYVRNRPFYTGDLVETEIFDLVALMDAAGYRWLDYDGFKSCGYVVYGDPLCFDTPLVAGDRYKISYNGETGEYPAIDGANFDDPGFIYICDVHDLSEFNPEDIHFIVVCAPYTRIDSSDTSGRWFIYLAQDYTGTVPTELKVIEKKQEIKKIDKTFLPDELNENFVLSVNGVVADENKNVNLTPKDIGASKLFVVTETTSGTVDKSGEQIRDAYLAGYVVILVPLNGDKMMYLLTVGRKGSHNSEGYKFFSVGISSDLYIPYFTTATIYSDNTVTYETEDLARYVESQSHIILNSSTEGSTKRFSVTVDDSGTLSTTETL